jgi:membrane-bound inhibitor of C-type lysozyme
MKQPYTYIGLSILALAIIIFGVYAYTHLRAPDAPAVTASTSYLCRDGKTIDASFTDGSATLTLSDTRALVLPQAISGSGVRYEKDGAVFVGKGDNAFLEENGTQTYVDCIATGSPSGATAQSGYKTFADKSGTFSFTYPSTVSVTAGDIGYTQAWMVNATSSGLTLTKATLGKSFQPNTNFSEATLTVGTSADPSAVATCLTYNPSGGPSTAPSKVTINGTSYTVFHESDAGAGNRYDTTSYRTLRSDQCYVVEYTIHSTAIGNYSPDQGIKEFDMNAVANIMDDVVQSFRFTDGA